MRSFYITIVAGLLVAACAGGAFTFDGSYYLFKILDMRAPFIPHQRWPIILPQVIVLTAAQFTGNTSVLAALFGLVYAIVPLASLMLSWWMIRDTAPRLFRWPAFCICLGTAVLQLHFISEAIVAIHLFWPLLFAALTQARGMRLAAAILLALIVVSIHPYGAVLSGVAALVMLSLWLCRRSTSDGHWRWAVGFGALSTAAIVRFIVSRTPYEADQVTSIAFNQQLNATLGLAGVALTLTCIAALLALVAEITRNKISRELFRAIYLGQFTAITGAMLFLIMWASRPSQWSALLNLKLLALAVTTLLIILASLDYIYYTRTNLNIHLLESDHCWRTVQLVSVVFCIVLIVQSMSWWNVRSGFSETITQSSHVCIPANTLETIRGTSLDHWSIVAYSLLTQSSAPRHIIVNEAADCKAENLRKGFKLTPWEFRDWKNGQLDFSNLHAQLSNQ